jgi:hypothetical protein
MRRRFASGIVPRMLFVGALFDEELVLLLLRGREIATTPTLELTGASTNERRDVEEFVVGEQEVGV